VENIAGKEVEAQDRIVLAQLPTGVKIHVFFGKSL
jgi:hypothetical protein